MVCRGGGALANGRDITCTMYFCHVLDKHKAMKKELPVSIKHHQLTYLHRKKEQQTLGKENNKIQTSNLKYKGYREIFRN